MIEVSLRNVSKSYVDGDGSEIRVLSDTTLSLPNVPLAIIGPSGSGKTTLLNLLGMITLPDKGTVTVDGISSSALSDAQRSTFRLTKVGFVFQEHELLPDLKVWENVAVPRVSVGHSFGASKTDVNALLEKIGCSELANRFPHELSGGQRQRIAVARALVNDPVLILADEPTGNLDKENSTKIVDLLLNVCQGKRLIVVTHDMEIAATISTSLTLGNSSLILHYD